MTLSGLTKKITTDFREKKGSIQAVHLSQTRSENRGTESTDACLAPSFAPRLGKVDGLARREEGSDGPDPSSESDD